MKTLLIGAILLMSHPQEPKTVDEVMSNTRKALAKASSIRLEFSGEYVEEEGREGAQKKNRGGDYLFTAEGKAYCQIFNRSEKDPKDRLIIEVISTGSRIGARKDLDRPFEISEVPIQPFPDLADAIFYLGLQELPFALAQAAKRAAGGKEKAELLGALRQRIDISISERIEMEKVDGRECAVIGFSMTPKGQDKAIGKVRLWIDRKTWMPVRREQKFETPSRKGVVTDNYKSITIDGKLDPTLFDLPGEAK